MNVQRTNGGKTTLINGVLPKGKAFPTLRPYDCLKGDAQAVWKWVECPWQILTGDIYTTVLNRAAKAEYQCYCWPICTEIGFGFEFVGSRSGVLGATPSG